MHSATSAFILAVHRASRNLSHDQFKPWIFDELGRYLRFDSGMWMRIVVHDAGPQMVDYYLDRQRPDRISSYVEQELWREDPFMNTAFMNGPQRAWAMSARSIPSGRLSDYLELHEQRNVVCSFEFEPIVRSFAGFAMFRKGEDDEFDEDDRQFVEFAEPHLRDAWTHNWLREVGASRPRDMPPEFAQAVFTSGCVLSAGDDRLPAIVRKEWPDWQGPLMPLPLAEHLARRARSPWLGEHIVVYFVRLSHELVLLRARESHALDRLSPRLRKVAVRFAKGASQREVADELGLSPSTVNNYLVAIYRDLGVDDKAALAVMIDRLEPGRAAAPASPSD